MKFMEYMDKKERENQRHLEVLGKLLAKAGLNIEQKFDVTGEDPHLYILNPIGEKSTFEGIRLYTVGDHMSYRVQRREDTKPYGRAYLLDVEGIFEDLVDEHSGEKEEETALEPAEVEMKTKIAKSLTKTLLDEINSFFNKSHEAEQETEKVKQRLTKPSDILGKIISRPSETGTDYSDKVHSRQ